jgi:hypothetical protein
MHGKDLIRELGLGRGHLEELDRDLENLIYKLETGQPLDAYTREDTVRLLNDFWDLLARLDDLRYVDLVGDDDEDDEEDDEEDEEAKVATSPDAASPDAAAVDGEQ